MTFLSIHDDVIKQALCTYINKGTRYLSDAYIKKSPDSKVILNASFVINESCYLYPFSGHFNVVEALMCFNQMLYVALLGGIKHQLFPFYLNNTPEQFNQHRREVYIMEIDKMKFRKQIDNHHFYGTLSMEKLHTIGDKIYMHCSFSFGNNKEGKDFFGNIKVFIPVLSGKG